MVSALTQEGAEVTLQALELGAVDFLPKPERNQLSEMRASRDLLVAKVLAAAQSRASTPGARAGDRHGDQRRRRGAGPAAAAAPARRPAAARRRPQPARRAS